MLNLAMLRDLSLSRSSWPGLSRPSTCSSSIARQDVDARHKPGHDVGSGRVTLPSRSVQSPPLAPDPSFQRLLGELAWRRLAPAIRERFRWKPAAGAEIRYVGEMAVVRSSRLGWAMAQLCRLIGTPLAPHRGRNIPVRVTLSLDTDGAGVVWRRVYRFPNRRAVACVSVKRSTATEGLIECVGGGVGMWLRLSERAGALHFRSTGYFWALGNWRVPLPAWLTPGALHVTHSDEGEGRFRFRISVTHPFLGETFFQDGIFSSEGSEPWSAC
jgi:uncharacterized protein DUF4166